jgi:hypothetical protein
MNKFKQIKNKHKNAKIVKPNLKHPKSKKELNKEINKLNEILQKK